MPLSEHEERILAEIERQLAAEDPRFASGSGRRRRSPRLGSWSRTIRLRIAVALAVVGVLLVLGLTFNIALGAIGLGMILTAILLGGVAVREHLTATVPPDQQD